MKKFVVICKNLSRSAMYIMEGGFNMTKDEEIRMINEKLDFYVMEQVMRSSIPKRYANL